MKRLALASWIVAITLSTAAGAAGAQSAVNGPYYATPSWDQTLPASTRFLVLSNFNGDAVLDRETGLVWQRALHFSANYDDAFSSCLAAKTGGRYGWRLPTMPELISLFDPSVTTVPALPIGHPFTGFSSPSSLVMFSSTPYPRLPGHWKLFDGTSSLRVQGISDIFDGNFFCVRGPGSSD